MMRDKQMPKTKSEPITRFQETNINIQSILHKPISLSEQVAQMNDEVQQVAHEQIMQKNDERQGDAQNEIGAYDPISRNEYQDSTLLDIDIWLYEQIEQTYDDAPLSQNS